MKIIDFEKRGNLVRFYLGKDDDEEYRGDDWDDAPYEHNAERVCEKYIVGHHDIVFPFGFLVLEPADGVLNSRWKKDDMKKGNVACIAVLRTDDNSLAFEDIVINKQAALYYFGDHMSPTDTIEIFGEDYE